MKSEAIKPIVYSNIKEKNILESKMFAPLSPVDSLIQALDIMDLYASLRKRPNYPEDAKYPWIILNFRK